MTTSELLDQAAALAREGKRVAVVALTEAHREIFRRGLVRRLDMLTLGERVALLSPPSAPPALTFDVVLVDRGFEDEATPSQLVWLKGVQATPKAIEA